MLFVRRNGTIPYLLARHLRTRARSAPTVLGNSTLVGPPDPVSNIRPVLRGPSTGDGIQTAHPYSVSEFSRSEVVGYSVLALHERHLETLNHSFWTDVCPLLPLCVHALNCCVLR